MIGSSRWACFEDWINGTLGQIQDWTIVAQVDKYPTPLQPTYEVKTIFSYLTPKGKHLNEIFDHDTWDADCHFGSSEIYYKRGRRKDSEIVQCQEAGNKLKRPFITLKESQGSYGSFWRLWPTFEDYFDLRSNGQGAYVDPFKQEEVVKFPPSSHTGPVLVRTDYLRDYLASRNMVLIRQHDHRRHWPQPIAPFVLPSNNGQVVRQDWGCYRLDVYNNELHRPPFSRLMAKDIIHPYKQSGIIGGKWEGSCNDRDYPEFITCRSDDGESVKMKPNAGELLHLTYFDPKVLKRYYDQPSLYTVFFDSPGMGQVSKCNQWSVTIGRNEEDLITLWLGDLAKQGLSLEEVNHWRAHNVAPRGSAPKDFIEAQLECNPASTPSLESKLVYTRQEIIKAIESKGKCLYRPYSGPDQDIQNLLRIPLLSEHGEFSESIIILSKMFIEYLNNEDFSRELGNEYLRDTSGNKLGPIAVLSNWLQQVIQVPFEVADNLKKALQNLQMVRSKTGVAHRFSDSSYDEVITKLAISKPINPKVLFLRVAEPLAICLQDLCRTLGVENELWWIKYAK
jgi:hypothetical protein